jgi:hypothetical protein
MSNSMFLCTPINPRFVLHLKLSCLSKVVGVLHCNYLHWIAIVMVKYNVICIELFVFLRRGKQKTMKYHNITYDVIVCLHYSRVGYSEQLFQFRTL